MDGFSYVDIFDTKGIEYLIIIGFLILIIPFWIVLNRTKIADVKVRMASGILSDAILNIPMGIFFSKNHTWAFLEKSGSARTGLDDFLLHVTGDVSVSCLKKQGEKVNRGEIMAEIIQNGKTLRIVSPLSGTIVEKNPGLNEQGIMEGDPYDKAWIYRIMPAAWIEETSSYLLAENARAWFRREIERFRDLMAEYFRQSIPGNPMLVLQDGGELLDRPLAELPDEAWHIFEKSFLTSEAGT
jgi:glycine cleavage system H protein